MIKIQAINLTAIDREAVLSERKSIVAGLMMGGPDVASINIYG